MASLSGQLRAAGRWRDSDLPRGAKEITSYALSSPLIGTILSVISSYLREWVLRLAWLSKGYICVADSTALSTEVKVTVQREL